MAQLVSVDASPIHRTTDAGIAFIRIILEALKKIDLEKIYDEEKSKWLMGSGCSSVVERTPRNLEVMGLNPVGFSSPSIGGFLIGLMWRSNNTEFPTKRLSCVA